MNCQISGRDDKHHKNSKHIQVKAMNRGKLRKYFLDYWTRVYLWLSGQYRTQSEVEWTSLLLWPAVSSWVCPSCQLTSSEAFSVSCLCTDNGIFLVSPTFRIHTPCAPKHVHAYTHTHTQMLTPSSLDKWASPECPVTLPKSPSGKTGEAPRFLEAYVGEGAATGREKVGSAADPLCHLHFSDP